MDFLFRKKSDENLECTIFYTIFSLNFLHLDQICQKKCMMTPFFSFPKTRKTDFLSLDCIQAFLRKINKIQVVPLVRWSKSVFYERPPRMLRSGAGMNRLFWHFSTLRHFHGRNPRISTLTILKSSDHPLFKMVSTSARQFCLGISSSGTQW